MAKVSKKTEKAIIWGRTSTIYQEIDEQVNEMIEYALNDGYSKDNIIIIKSKGASAIKQNALYKKEVEELLTKLKSDKSIKCAYTWEISRIARVESVFYQMKEYFINNKIQLVVKTPSIRLLNENGEVDPSQELILNLMMTLAKQEMSLKKKRMMRGARVAKTQGKFGGGANLLYGYGVDNDGYIVVNEDEANVVRDIFNMYLNENMSAGAIFKHFAERGIFNPNMRGNSVKVGKITAILTNYSYAGLKGHYKRNGEVIESQHIYPAIVEKETIDKAVEMIEKRKHMPKTTTKNIYYAKGLLKCAECGYIMAAKRNNVVYRCEGHGHNMTININAVDCVAWTAASALNDWYIYTQSNKNKADYEKQIDENETILSTKTNEMSDIQARMDRLNDLYIDGVMNKDKYTTKLNALQDEMNDVQKQITATENKIYQLKGLLSNIEDNAQEGVILPYSDQVEDDATRREIIVKVIDYISVEKIGDRQFRLKVYNKVGRPMDDEWFEVYTKANKVNVLQHFGNTTLNITRYMDKRFKQQ